MDAPVPDILLEAWDGQPVKATDGYEYVVNPLTDQSPACDPELLEAACEWLAANAEFESADLILGEEDRGGILVSHLATLTRTPFALAKWYPSSVAGEHEVGMQNGYADGSLFINGVEPGDEVVIVDDMVSTGATMIALIKAMQDIGANVREAVVLCEKPDFGGVAQVAEETGVDVAAGFRVHVDDGQSTVVADHR